MSQLSRFANGEGFSEELSGLEGVDEGHGAAENKNLGRRMSNSRCWRGRGKSSLGEAPPN